MLLGSVEAGGTKFVCAVGDENYRVIETVAFKTTTPEETLGQTVAFFKRFKDLKAIGIGSFGPIEVRKSAPEYGCITKTPKKHWAHVNFVEYIKSHINVPIYWTTDVNGSAYGEYILSKQENEKLESIVYFTVGTGVGAGTIIDGKFLGSLGHAEAGHIRVKRHPKDMSFSGICPYHEDCLEGLVSGPTFEARLGKSGREVPFTNPVWGYMAYYIAQAVLDYTLTIRPNQIVFGGGVISETFLDMIRKEFADLLNDYVDVPNLKEYLRMPRAEDNGSATIGDFALATKALENEAVEKL